MKKRKESRYWGLAVGLLLSTGTTITQAGIIAVNLGSGAPPGTLGGYNMSAFPTDTLNPVYPLSFLDVTTVPGPGGSLTFDQPLTHDLAGDINTGWATWSHGYTGDVYDTVGAANPNSVTISLPNSTYAFDFYIEPTPFLSFDITATAQDGTFITETVLGQGGASGYGFYTTAGWTLTSIAINAPGTDFAVGEFGINVGSTGVPEGGSTLCYALLGLLPLCGLALRLNRAA